MERFVVGEVVVVRFPFSDLSNSKLRPALVLADWGGEDIILCQITSKNKNAPFSLALEKTNFRSGTLPHDSFIKVNRLFTADKSIIIKSAGTVKKAIVNKVEELIKDLLITSDFQK